MKPTFLFFTPMRLALSGALLGSALAMTACGGGADPATQVPAPPSTPPALSYTLGGTVIGLTGSSPLMVLQNNGGNNLTMNADGAFTFSPALASATAYNVTVLTQPALHTCTVANGSGTVAAAHVTNVAVTCIANKAWQTAALIETDNAGDAFDPQIAIDVNGNALAVWRQSDGTRFNIWSNRYTAVTGWGTATLIETDNVGDAFNPQVAFDANGNALAVWHQADNIRFNIWSNRYTAGTGWGTAVQIETDNAGSAELPKIAVTANGNALAVWSQLDGARFNIWSNRYTAGMGWGTAVLIETNNIGSAYSPEIAVDTSGNALAVWSQLDGTGYNIWSNRYTAGTGWGTAVAIETGSAGPAGAAKIAVDALGNMLAVWQQSDGTRNNIWSNRYTAGLGWGTPVMIETDNAGDADDSQIAIDDNGNAVAVWKQVGGSRYNIWSNRYTMGTGWGTAVLLETDNAGGAFNPQIAMDVNGNALAVWAQDDGTRFNMWSNRYVAGSGWGTAVLIETDNAGDAYNPQSTLDASGNALAVWAQSDGTRYNIWSNAFR